MPFFFKFGNESVHVRYDLSSLSSGRVFDADYFDTRSYIHPQVFGG